MNPFFKKGAFMQFSEIISLDLDMVLCDLE